MSAHVEISDPALAAYRAGRTKALRRAAIYDDTFRVHTTIPGGDVFIAAEMDRAGTVRVDWGVVAAAASVPNNHLMRLLLAIRDGKGLPLKR